MGVDMGGWVPSPFTLLGNPPRSQALSRAGGAAQPVPSIPASSSVDPKSSGPAKLAGARASADKPPCPTRAYPGRQRR